MRHNEISKRSQVKSLKITCQRLQTGNRKLVEILFKALTRQPLKISVYDCHTTHLRLNTKTTDHFNSLTLWNFAAELRIVKAPLGLWIFSGKDIEVHETKKSITTTKTTNLFAFPFTHNIDLNKIINLRIGMWDIKISPLHKIPW